MPALPDMRRSAVVTVFSADTVLTLVLIGEAGAKVLASRRMERW